MHSHRPRPIIGTLMLAPFMFLCGSGNLAGVPLEGKTGSAFFPPVMVKSARKNAAAYPWAGAIRDELLRQAKRYRDISDDALWEAMFGSTITRSWMVWSDGQCPSCKKTVSMYNWQADAIGIPWKMRCPHCRELFPKNDFGAFYRSGLDEHGIFDPKRADRKLLFNAEHPDPKDPLHLFGVDDGEGYVDGAKRWRFIGTYLIYGQWYQFVLAAIESLGNAYVVTGDPVYAHKAGVLLDRVADLYPTFDGAAQIISYERPGPGNIGYVTVWHNCCEDTRKLALAYDQVFTALRQDRELATFLAGKAAAYKLDNPKTAFADIQRNIEERILRDAERNRPKLESNAPRTDICLIMIKTVLRWPANRDEVYRMIDVIVERSTRVDGLTGEKGLGIYCALSVQGLATFLEQYAQMDPQFLPDMLARHPKLRQTWRFHLDTACLSGKYFPQSGDTGIFGCTFGAVHQGVDFLKRGLPLERDYNSSLPPSMYSFLWRLSQATADPAYLQVLWKANEQQADGLPYDLFVDDPVRIQKAVRDAVTRLGPEPLLGSVNKAEWCLAILRSGAATDARAAWLDYDSMGPHGHADGMNLGLFAKGLDLLPDCGYPPVQFGGWGSPKALWYQMSAAHNTVVVDGENHSGKAFRFRGLPDTGRTTFWGDGKQFRIIRASGANLIGGKQFERTVALVDVTPADSYVIDLLRVVGGREHAKFTHSNFGKITTAGLTLKEAPEYGHDTLMRNFRCDPAPQPGWSVDWTLDDFSKLLPPGKEVHLRYTDLTRDAQAYTAEGWVGIKDTEYWIPRIMVKRQAAEAPLASIFVSVLEPWEKGSPPPVAEMRRLGLLTAAGEAYPEAHLAVDLKLADGRRDLFISVDTEVPLGQTPIPEHQGGTVVVKEYGLEVNAEQALVRFNATGQIERLVICKGRKFSQGELKVVLAMSQEFMELEFTGDTVTVVSGNPWEVVEITRAGKRVQVLPK